MKIRRIDHIGIVVRDLDAAKAFFLEFGLELEGEALLEGGWVDEVVGIENVRSTICVMRAPEGGSNIELIQYHRPQSDREIEELPPNEPGLRNIAFVVDDIDALVLALSEKGIRPFGSVQQYQDIYKLCYVFGPEGIILMLVEELKKTI